MSLHPIVNISRGQEIVISGGSGPGVNIMSSVIVKSVVLQAPEEDLFDMYLDPAGHAALTGGLR